MSFKYFSYLIGLVYWYLIVLPGCSRSSGVGWLDMMTKQVFYLTNEIWLFFHRINENFPKSLLFGLCLLSRRHFLFLASKAIFVLSLLLLLLLDRNWWRHIRWVPPVSTCKLTRSRCRGPLTLRRSAKQKIEKLKKKSFWFLKFTFPCICMIVNDFVLNIKFAF